MWLGIVAVVIGIVVLIAFAIYKSYTEIAITNCNQLERISRTHSNRVNRLSFMKKCDCKRIEIGDYCFGKVRVFELDGLSDLESVVIGEWSFRISSSERSDGDYRIVNCPKLKSIQIGSYSFYDYHTFELNELSSLESIVFGVWCFHMTPSFSLTGLIDGLI